jgi:hypothetical protein
VSAAFDIIPRPDWASTTIVAIPHDATDDPATWARAIFDVRSVPSWVKVLFGARAVAARLLRLPPGNQAMLAVDRVIGDEAVIDTDDVHLHFAAGVRADPADGLVFVTTAVTFKGLRGRIYFIPVRILHDAVTRSMIDGAIRRMGGEWAANGPGGRASAIRQGDREAMRPRHRRGRLKEHATPRAFVLRPD